VAETGVALTVNTVARKVEISPLFHAGAGKTFLVVDISVENTWNANEPYNPLYFKVKDSEGYEYIPGLVADDRPLTAGELPPGDRARGTVTFEIAGTSRGLTLSYQPLVIFGGYRTIRIALGD